MAAAFLILAVFAITAFAQSLQNKPAKAHARGECSVRMFEAVPKAGGTMRLAMPAAEPVPMPRVVPPLAPCPAGHAEVHSPKENKERITVPIPQETSAPGQKQ